MTRKNCEKGAIKNLRKKKFFATYYGPALDLPLSHEYFKVVKAPYLKIPQAKHSMNRIKI